MEANNVKAMRDALVAVKKSIDGLGASSLDCDPTILMASLTMICGRLSARIEHALAAPARNCDLPLRVDGPANNNADKAWLAFKRCCPDAHFDVPGLLRCIDWLLAAATQKGATDGK